MRFLEVFAPLPDPDGALRVEAACEVDSEMPELMRSIAARLRRFVGDRRRARRYKTRLLVNVSLLAAKTGNSATRRVPSLQGHTCDISASGIALIVPSIRIGGHYLTGEDRVLRLTLALPAGPTEVQVVPVRYERLEEEEEGYLIGARITEMSDNDRGRYVAYLRTLGLRPEEK